MFYNPLALPRRQVNNTGRVNRVLLLCCLLSQRLQSGHHFSLHLLHSLDVIVRVEECLGRDDVFDFVKILLEVQPASDLDIPGLTDEILNLSDLTEDILLVRSPGMLPGEVVFSAVTPLTHVLQCLQHKWSYRIIASEEFGPRSNQYVSSWCEKYFVLLLLLNPTEENVLKPTLLLCYNIIFYIELLSTFVTYSVYYILLF